MPTQYGTEVIIKAKKVRELYIKVDMEGSICLNFRL